MSKVKKLKGTPERDLKHLLGPAKNRVERAKRSVAAKAKKENLADLLGKPKRAKVRKPKRAKVRKDDLGDLLGKPKRAKVRKESKYRPLPVPKDPEPSGIFAAREKKGQNLGRTCLNPECKAPLAHKRGRPPVICGKKACFRYYRNAYRRDYDKVRAA